MKNVVVSDSQTFPSRQNTMKKNRNRGVQRSMTSIVSSSQRSLDDSKVNDNFDTVSIASEAGVPGMKRKPKKFRQSFLKKSMSRKNY